MSSREPNRPIWMDLPGGSKPKKGPRAKKPKHKFKVGDIVAARYSLGHFSGRRIPTLSAGEVLELSPSSAKYRIRWVTGHEGWYEEDLLA